MLVLLVRGEVGQGSWVGTRVFKHTISSCLQFFAGRSPSSIHVPGLSEEFCCHWFHLVSLQQALETLTKNCLGAMADRLLLVGMELSQIETQIKSATIMTCYETKVKVSSLQFGAPCGCLYPVYDGSPFTAKPWTSCSKPPVPSLQAICVLALGMGYISIVGGTIRRRESRHFLKS